MIKLVLASQSPSRRDILKRLCISFQAMSPSILEEKSPEESPQDYVQRLSLEKAQKIQGEISKEALKKFEDIWIIGNDQTGVCEGKIYEKPETLDVGLQFFRDFSGKTLAYYSGMTLLSCKTGQFQTAFAQSSVKFLQLDEQRIRQYFALCPSALQCASGLKTEGPGVMLLESIEISDPYAAPGLPVFLLEKLCRNWEKSLWDFCEHSKSSLELVL